MSTDSKDLEERFVSRNEDIRLVNVREPGDPVPIEKEESKDA